DSFGGALDMPDVAVDEAKMQGMRLSLAYFSYTTLTTVGYGDILARTSLARVVAILEAVTRPLYVMIVVARLVSLQVAYSQSAPKEEPKGDRPPHCSSASSRDARRRRGSPPRSPSSICRP